jgi:hypothetical protein
MAKLDKAPEKRPLGSGRLVQLLWANLIFWAFLMLVMALVYVSASSAMDDDYIKMVLSDTAWFILKLFGFGFTLVTLFDLGYESFASHAEGGETPRQV